MKNLKKMLVRVWSKAANTRVRFNDGVVYQSMPDGSIRRVSPLKPWANKSEHRRVIRARREDREQAEMNAGILRDSRGACGNCAS